MSRFQISLAIAIAGAVVAAVGLHGHARLVTIAAITAAEIAAFSIGMAKMSLNFFLPAICHGRRGSKAIALTFDDGPDPAATPALLDLLARENVPASFFVIGKHVAAHPEIARRIVTDGHLIGNHSYHHSWMMSFTRGKGMTRELKLGQEAIHAAIGQSPLYYRPPMGLTNPHVPYALKQTGMKLIGWDVRPFDTVRPADAVIEQILRHTRDGSIILLHDGGSSAERVVEIVGTLIRELRSRGFQFERLDQMIDH